MTDQPKASDLVQGGEDIYVIEFRGGRPHGDAPVLYTADQLKEALGLGNVQSATFVGRIAGD